ncbi:MAG: peptidoglycan hydrolase [Acidobacteria bacterium]|nr:peptidoglycan hydrolase [Acidobacteriota bacterium]
MLIRSADSALYRSKIKLWLPMVVLIVGMISMLVYHSYSAVPDPRNTAGYVVYWDQDRGFASVERNASALGTVSPWWYSLNWSGEVVRQHNGITEIDHKTVASLRARNIKIIPTIANHRDGWWDNEVVGSVLGDPDRVRAHVRGIVDLVVRQGYDGIDVDYENLNSTDRDAFTGFVRELSTSLRAHGKTLVVDLHAKTSDAGADERNFAQNYAAIGAAADQVRIMTYDFHWQTSAPGPLAPIGWVDEVIAWTVTQIPREKIVIGLPLVGYDWVAGWGEPITWEEAQARAHEYQATINYDPGIEAPWFTYVDDADQKHTVWFENVHSVAAKLELVHRHDIAGVFFWRLGGEDPRIWPLVRPDPS